MLPQAPAPDEGFWSDLLRVYTPRRVCMFDDASVIGLHVFSDLLITAAYFSIPVALIVFVRRRTDLAFNWMFKMFAMFIFACGMTHLIGVLDIWHPLYKIDGLLKLYTGIVSAATAVLLWRLIPVAVALPSPAALRAANAELARMRDDLEERVESRTRELAEAGERERAARTEAERANRSKDEFLAVLSHELRTPLSAIVWWAHLLSQEDLDAGERRQGIEVIERSARAQNQLIGDLLDMSRITSGKLRLDVQTIDLTRVIEDAMETVQPAATAREISLGRSLDAHAGPVRGDRDRLQQVVWNLLSNAVKFTDKGGRVSVVLEKIEGHVEIRVTDTGRGLRPDHLASLFDRFRNEECSMDRTQSGLGLGLAIVRSLVEMHGGSVRAESEGEGKGCTFRVILPITPTPARREDGARAIPSAPVFHEDSPILSPDLLKGLRILVVDDEPDARELLRILLERAGATVLLAASSEAGFDLLKRERPDVLVSDIGMPDEDGLAMIRSVRKLSPEKGGETPALALTAFARAEDRRLAMISGFHLHLAKPVEPAALALAVAKLAGRAGSS